MSDKPLDCIGVTGHVGKCDFRAATTATASSPSIPSLDQLTEIMKGIENQPHHLKVGKDWLAYLKSPIFSEPPEGIAANLFGFKFLLDEQLPPGLMQLKTKDGKALRTYQLESKTS